MGFRIYLLSVAVCIAHITYADSMLKFFGGTNVVHTLEILEEKFVHRTDQNFILMIFTEYDGTCQYCNYLSQYGMGADYKQVMEKYGCAEMDMLDYRTARKFGVDGDDVMPLVSLYPNPKSTANNTNTWYEQNKILDFPHLTFETASNAKTFPVKLENAILSYTNEVHFADVRSNVVEEVRTNSTVKADVTTDTSLIVKVVHPQLVKEGSNATFTVSINALKPQEFTILIACNGILKSKTDTGSITSYSSDISIEVDADDQFDINTSNQYNIVVGPCSVSVGIPLEDILVKTTDCGIYSIDGLWFLDYDDILNCMSEDDMAAGIVAVPSNCTLTIHHLRNTGSEVRTNGVLAGYASPSLSLSVHTNDVIMITSPTTSKFDVFNFWN